mgnify:CR=1 FL=1
MINKNIAVLFPKDSEAMFNRTSKRTFGGATIHLYHFVKELYHYTNIYTLLPEYDTIDFDDADNFNIIKLYKESDIILLKFIKFFKFIKNHEIDIIMQLGLTIESCLLAFFCKVLGIQFVFFFGHDIESLGYYQNSRKKCILFPLLIKNSALLIAQNEIEKENILKRYPDITKVKVLKKGIDLTKIVKVKEKKYDGAWIARCDEWKNAESYLKIVSMNKNYNFLLVANPVSGKEDYFNKIKTIASNFKNLTFYPFVKYEDIYKLLAESKVFFVTSDMEGDWPLTVIEAAASGVPTISLNYDYGVLIDIYNAGCFCEGSIEKMNNFFLNLMNNPLLLQKYAQNAYKFVEDNHNNKRNAKILIEWIFSL